MSWPPEPGTIVYTLCEVEGRQRVVQVRVLRAHIEKTPGRFITDLLELHVIFGKSALGNCLECVLEFGHFFWTADEARAALPGCSGQSPASA